MSREIKFRRAYFFDEECTQFSHYSEWGVRIKGSEFTSPSYNNFATYFVDYQFTGLKDKNRKDIYEGDLVRYKNGTSTPINIVHEGKNLTAYESNYSESYVVFYKGCFSLHNEPTMENHEKSSKYNGTSYSGEINRYNGFEYEIIGNIHEQ